MFVQSVRRGAALLLLSVAPVWAQEGAAPGPDTVVATVNGTEITLGDLRAVRADLPPLPPTLTDEVLYDGLRTQLVNQSLLAQAAEAGGVAADAEIARLLEIQRQGLLAQVYLRRMVEERMTEEALRAEYDATVGAAPPVREVRASHILVAEEAKAKELKAQIDAGADFAALAAEHGTDGTKAQGGDLGYFTREVMVPEFADAAFGMEVGAVSDPVQTQFGWHLIKLTDSRDQPKPSFEDVREELETTVGNRIVTETLAELTEAADVTVVEDRPGMATLRDGPDGN